MNKDSVASDLWFDIDAPMLADTFGADAPGFGDSWFDSSPFGVPLAPSSAQRRAEGGASGAPKASHQINFNGNIGEGQQREQSLPKDGKEAATKNQEATPKNVNGTSLCMTKKKSYDIITVDKERVFSGNTSADKMPEAIKKTTGIYLSPVANPQHPFSRTPVRLGLSQNQSMKKASASKAKTDLRFCSPASGLRVTAVKAVTTPKPFKFLNAFASREQLKESLNKKKPKITSAAQNGSTNLAKEHKWQTERAKRREESRAKENRTEPGKETKLKERQDKVLSDSKIKSSSMVRSTSPGFGQPQKALPPTSSKGGNVDVLGRKNQRSDKPKEATGGVFSRLLTPVLRARHSPCIPKPPLQKCSNQQKATSEAVAHRPPLARSASSSSTPHRKGVTQVKPFSFETEKRHEHYMKVKEEQDAAGTKAKPFGLAKQASVPDLKKTADTRLMHKAASVDRLNGRFRKCDGAKNEVAGVKATNLMATGRSESSKSLRHHGHVTQVKPFVFETQKRHEQHVASASKMTSGNDGVLERARNGPAIPSAAEIRNQGRPPRILPLKRDQAKKPSSRDFEHKKPTSTNQEGRILKRKNH